MTDYTCFDIEFHDNVIAVIEWRGIFYVPIKPIINHLGINWQTQVRKLNNFSYKQYYNIYCINFEDSRPDGSVNKMLCIALTELHTYLNTINLRFVPKWARENIEYYQHNCAKSLINSLNSPNLEGVEGITTSYDPYFLEVVVKQNWDIKALANIGIHVDPTEFFSLEP